ncbi:hypothetical protein ACQKGO_33425 [Corallococcus interemptor]|uniref:hypothetical protein n=1 Tax=Corallococcus interemptor TaxID=2316720 RepID=UPI003D05DB16
MTTRKKSDTAHKPGFAKDRVDRGLEADDTKPLYGDDVKHSTEEQKFALDSDGPVGGPVANPQSVLDNVDDEEREERGRLKAEARQEENEPTRE